MANNLLPNFSSPNQLRINSSFLYDQKLAFFGGGWAEEECQMEKEKLFQNEDSEILFLWRCPVRTRNMAHPLCSDIEYTLTNQELSVADLKLHIHE